MLQLILICNTCWQTVLKTVPGHSSKCQPQNNNLQRANSDAALLRQVLTLVFAKCMCVLAVLLGSKDSIYNNFLGQREKRESIAFYTLPSYLCSMHRIFHTSQKHPTRI